MYMSVHPVIDVHTDDTCWYYFSACQLFHTSDEIGLIEYSCQRICLLVILCTICFLFQLLLQFINIHCLFTGQIGFGGIALQCLNICIQKLFYHIFLLCGYCIIFGVNMTYSTSFYTYLVTGLIYNIRYKAFKITIAHQDIPMSVCH